MLKTEKYYLKKDLVRKRFKTLEKGTQVFLNKTKEDSTLRFYDLHWNWICNIDTFTSRNFIESVEE